MDIQNVLKLKIIEGDTAPRYDVGTELTLEEVVITEQGTVAGLPIVDVKMRGPDGEFYLLVLTGRIVNSIAMAVRGINMRNHGKEEP
jgi:hypothetical protein